MIIFDFSHYRNKHWYPGHMLKAIKEIKTKLSLVDIAIIIHDARIPQISYNPTFDKILQSKAILHIINKCDMIPKKAKEEWFNFYKKSNQSVLFTELNKRSGINNIFIKIKNEVTKNRQKKKYTRPLLRPIRAMIVGVPNIGKSTLINNIKKRKIAKAGPKPGLTRHQQWVKLSQNIELLDTPGIMHPQATGCEEELRLGLANIIRREIIGEEIICQYLLYLLHLNQENNALKIYGINSLPETVEDMLQQVAKKRGLLLTDGKFDYHKATRIILNDYDKSKFPPLAFEFLKGKEKENPAIQAKFYQKNTYLIKET